MAASRPAIEDPGRALAPVRAERRSHDAARGHAVVAMLGQRSLADADSPLLLDQTVSLGAARTSGSDGLLGREGLSHTVAMRIPGRSRPYRFHCRGAARAHYSREGLFFIHTVANALGAAFERAATDHDVRRELALYSEIVEAAADGIFVSDATWTRHGRQPTRDRDVESARVCTRRGSVEAWLAEAHTS